MLKKGYKFTADIIDLTSQGLGVAKISTDEGTLYPFFVKDTAIGDTVACVATKIGKNFGYARALEVVNPSKDRVNPKCENSRRCGGCQIQHMSYESQLRWKEKFVKEQLKRIGGIDESEYEFLNIIPSEDNCGTREFRYRNKAQYPVSQDISSGNIVTGFYAERSHDVIECEDCLLQNESDEKILKTIKTIAQKEGIKAYDETTGKGLIRHVMIRNAGMNKEYSDVSEVMVCLVLNVSKKNYLKDISLNNKIRHIAEKIVEESDVNASVCLNFNDKATNVILGSEELNIFGRSYIEDNIGINKYRISAKSFFQINPFQTHKLYNAAVESSGITDKDVVWDLYCGTGTITLFAARKAKEVYGIEIIPEAIENAKENAKINNINNATFIVGKAEGSEIEKKFPKPDIVIVDPPRKGCDKEVINTLISAAPRKISYVSCNVTTQARDLRILKEAGYRIETVQPVDMFPQTTGVENVVILSRIHAVCEG